nr:discoidin domain-containing protein [Niabella hibiscisoli]
MLDGCADEVPSNGGFAPFQTCWKFDNQPSRFITLDLGKPVVFSKFYMLPARHLGYNGIVTAYMLQSSNDGQHFNQIKEGRWGMNADLKIASFDPVTARYIRMEIRASVGDAMISEAGVGN